MRRTKAKFTKHVRIVRIEKNPYNYGIMRSRIVRIGTLRIDFGLERIIPSHAFSPLSEKINFRKLKMRTNTYFYV